MKGLNALHFRNKLDFLFEFIPQIILLFALFGWMDILIIGKWAEKKNVDDIFLPTCKDVPEYKDCAAFNRVNKSPAIIGTMIDIFLNVASNAKKGIPTFPEEVEYNYVVGGQRFFSILFVLLAFVSVPIMLMVKPMILKKQFAAHAHHGEAGHGVDIKSDKIEYQGSGKPQKQLIGNEQMDQIADILR